MEAPLKIDLAGRVGLQEEQSVGADARPAGAEPAGQAGRISADEAFKVVDENEIIPRPGHLVEFEGHLLVPFQETGQALAPDQVLIGLPPLDDRVFIFGDHHLGRPGSGVVVGGHDKAVGPG